MSDRLIDGRYQPLERHAVGGMATVWRARDERTGEIVAIKRLHPYLVADPASRSRLVREAAALQALDHPAIVRPREIIDDPDDPVLVMDFAEGRSLQERLADDGAIDPEEAVAIAGTVADALAVAHDAGIVHRDVKPANILVEESGAVHLVDFGIASVTEANEAALTASETMVGTRRYSAPERLAGAAASPRSDVWAIGAVLYEMLTGRPAVTDDDRTASPVIDDLPPVLAAVVLRAMAPDPADRYADAAAFRDAILAGGRSVDPEARTTVVPVVQPAAEGPRRDTGRRLSPVDRAAAVFFGGVAALTLIVVIALGLAGGGQPAGPSVPAASGPVAAPSTTEAIISASPEATQSPGSGKSNGKGKGRGNGD